MRRYYNGLRRLTELLLNEMYLNTVIHLFFIHMTNTLSIIIGNAHLRNKITLNNICLLSLIPAYIIHQTC